MDKSPQTPATDITDEPYKGPSPFVTAMGQGFFDHLRWAIMGMALFGIPALVIPQKARAFINASRAKGAEFKAVCIPENATLWQHIPERTKRGFGNLIHIAFGEGESALRNVTVDAGHREWFDYVRKGKEHGFGHMFLSHTIGILPIVGRPFKRWLVNLPDYSANAITLGGVAGSVGYVSGWIKALANGGRHAHRAKDQFNRAKEEVREQRVINRALREKYIETKLELEDIKTNKAVESGTLRVAKDDPQTHPGTIEQPPPTDAIKVTNTLAGASPEGESSPAHWQKKIEAQKTADTAEPALA